MNREKTKRLLILFSWLGVAISGTLLAYMLHVLSRYRGLEELRPSAYLSGGLLAVWLIVAVFFTLRGRKERKDKNP